MRSDRSHTPVVAAIIGVTLALAACGGSSSSSPQSGSSAGDVSPAGDIPDTQAYVEFGSPDGKYSVKVPEGWARTDLASGASFTDKLNTIRVEDRATQGAPSEATARAADVPALSAGAVGFRLAGIDTVHRTAGDAVRVRFEAKGAADAVTGKRRVQAVEVYEFWRSGLLVTITLSSPRGADNVDPWRKVTSSFAWPG